jgi:hypothetical protein
MRLDVVRRYIAQRRRAAAARVEVDLAGLISETLTMAYVDIGDAYTDEGDLLPLHLIPERVRRAIVSVDRTPEGLPRVRWADKIAALRLVGQLSGLLVERAERGKPGQFDALSREEARARMDVLAAELGYVRGPSGAQ